MRLGFRMRRGSKLSLTRKVSAASGAGSGSNTATEARIASGARTSAACPPPYAATAVRRTAAPPSVTIGLTEVESECGAVTVGRSYLLAAPFVWRCLSGSAMAPFPHPAHRTGQADLPHPALGQDVTPSPTTGRDQAGSGVRARSARKGAEVDKLRPCVARLCA